jgi:hypothetical protein
MSRTLGVRNAVHRCGGRALAYFDQSDDINRVLASRRDQPGYVAFFNAVWRGVCYVLSTRFIIQSINGMPPLGIDLEKDLHARNYPLHSLPETSAIIKQFPQFLNWRLPITGSMAGQYQTRDSDEGTLFPMVDAWLAGQGYKRERIFCPYGTPPGPSGGISVAREMRERRELLLEMKGFGLLSLYDGERGHCLVIHTGASGEWMLMDVNYGWFLFPSDVHFEVFLAAFWFETGYEFRSKWMLDTFRRKRLR